MGLRTFESINATASAADIGGIKVGDGLIIGEDGTLSIDESNLYFTAGTHTVLNNIQSALAGFITSSSSTIVITIPVGKSLAKINNLSLGAYTNFALRTVHSGYVGYGGNQISGVSSLPSGVSAVVEKSGDFNIVIRLSVSGTFKRGTGSTAVDNNTPIAGAFTILNIVMS